MNFKSTSLMSRSVKGLVALVGCLLASGALLAQDELDRNLLRERIKKTHGDFRMKLSGEWQAGLEGRIESWTWTKKGWTCGKAEEPATCSSWTPESFLAWEGGGFLERWIPLKRISFEVQRPKVVSRPKIETVVEAEDAADATEDAEAQEPQQDWGHNWVGEFWIFQNAKNEELRVLVSSRDQRVERIEFPNGAVEYYEWFKGRSKILELSKVILEKNGQRTILSRK